MRGAHGRGLRHRRGRLARDAGDYAPGPFDGRSAQQPSHGPSEREELRMLEEEENIIRDRLDGISSHVEDLDKEKKKEVKQ